MLFEITLSNLRADGEINEQDFLDRAEILCSLGQTVLISNYQEYWRLAEYFSRYTKMRMGLIMGLTNLKEIFNEKYYRELKGGILEAMGVLFSNDLKMYVYPSQASPKSELQTLGNLKVHPRMKPLYDYLVFNKRVVDIENFDPSILQIFSPAVLAQIRNGEKGWEQYLPQYVDTLIKEKRLFGYQQPEEETVVLTDDEDSGHLG